MSGPGALVQIGLFAEEDILLHFEELLPALGLRGVQHALYDEVEKDAEDEEKNSLVTCFLPASPSYRHGCG